MKDMTILGAPSTNNHYTDQKVLKRGEVYFPVEEKVECKHVEHETITLPKRPFIVDTVVECDPMSKKIREIAD